MFKGKRDNHISIRVPQENCFKYKGSNDEEWCEVKMPGYTDSEWFSFMVRPDQVFYDYMNPDKYNILEGLNRDTGIIVSKKVMTSKHERVVVADSESPRDPVYLIKAFSYCNTDNLSLLQMEQANKSKDTSDKSDKKVKSSSSLKTKGKGFDVKSKYTMDGASANVSKQILPGYKYKLLSFNDKAFTEKKSSDGETFVSVLMAVPKTVSDTGALTFGVSSSQIIDYYSNNTKKNYKAVVFDRDFKVKVYLMQNGEWKNEYYNVSDLMKFHEQESKQHHLSKYYNKSKTKSNEDIIVSGQFSTDDKELD